jgi:hypothetical protein
MPSPKTWQGSWYTSDQAYELGSDQVEKYFSVVPGNKETLDAIQYARVELEFNATAFVSSSKIVWKQNGDSSEYTSSNRTVYLGSLVYDNAALKSITINKQVSWSALPDWNQNIIEVIDITGGFQVADVTSMDQWQQYAAALTERGITTFKYDDVNWDLVNQTPPVNTTSVEQFLLRSEAGYFENGWISDPTGLNTISDFSPVIISQSLVKGRSTGKDEVTGTANADALGAGKGADRLTGGLGADQFVFEVLDKFGKKNADVITDFNPEQGDLIVLSSAALPGLRAESQFTVATSKKSLASARTSGVSLIYYKPLGQLIYDQNGDGKGYGSGGLFAVLSGAPAITSEFISIIV